MFQTRRYLLLRKRYDAYAAMARWGLSKRRSLISPISFSADRLTKLDSEWITDQPQVPRMQGALASPIPPYRRCLFRSRSRAFALTGYRISSNPAISLGNFISGGAFASCMNFVTASSPFCPPPASIKVLVIAPGGICFFPASLKSSGPAPSPSNCFLTSMSCGVTFGPRPGGSNFIKPSRP
jgi:hypothetical protein